MSEQGEDTATAAVENRPKTLQPTSGYKSKTVIAFASIFVAILAVVVDRLVITPVLLKNTKHRGEIIETSARYDVVDEEVLSLFVTYDENLDGFLDLSEFVKVANRILHRKVSSFAFIFGRDFKKMCLKIITPITMMKEHYKLQSLLT